MQTVSRLEVGTLSGESLAGFGNLLVDGMGIEPTTSRVRFWRSPS